jgi:hypothetical protein
MFPDKYFEEVKFCVADSGGGEASANLNTKIKGSSAAKDTEICLKFFVLWWQSFKTCSLG